MLIDGRYLAKSKPTRARKFVNVLDKCDYLLFLGSQGTKIFELLREDTKKEVNNCIFDSLAS